VPPKKPAQRRLNSEKTFTSKVNTAPRRDPLKRSVIKWNKETNGFSLYEYDPVDTLGDLLPYHIKLLDDRLRKSRYYDAKSAFSHGCLIFWTIFLTVIVLVTALVLGIIWLSFAIGIWTIPASFGLAFLLFAVGFFFCSTVIKSRGTKIDSVLESRNREFNAILNQFMAEEPLFRELSHISISIGQFGSFLQLNYGNEYIDRTNGKKPHRINDYSDSAFVNNALEDKKPVDPMDYPVAQPF
jgi:hypothetical protein